MRKAKHIFKANSLQPNKKWLPYLLLANRLNHMHCSDVIET